MKKLLFSALILLAVISLLPSAAAETPEEDLFAGYVQQCFYPEEAQLQAVGQDTLGAKLTGTTKVLYDALVPLLKEVANGTRDTAHFTIGTSFMSGDGPIDADTEVLITDPTYSLEALIHALLADLPYDLYWFDKTLDIRSFGGYQCRTWTLTSGSSKKYTYEFNFYISKNYAADPEVPGPLTLDTAKTGAASKAAANAKAIVAEHTSKNDYQKLLAYKNTICDLVEYNHAALENDAPYGDPWQLIYVFDKNPSTDVVCEGYAKAFQYLCDISNFEKDITCYCVSGYSLGREAENMNPAEFDAEGFGHMWNVVAMDDGKNYLVDVTNCDSGSVGQGNGLFLVGAAYGGKIFHGIGIPGYLFQIDALNWLFYGYLYTGEQAKWNTTGMLNLSKTSYQYDPNDFHTHTWNAAPAAIWAPDYQSCRFVKTCTGDGCKQTQEAVCSNISWAAQGTKLKLTAGVLMNSYFYDDTKTFTAKDGKLALPPAKDGMIMWAAAYEKGQFKQLVPASGETLDLNSFPGDAVRVFFLKEGTHDPLLPRIVASH